ncbi:hypothetical protein ElyMa_004327400 [Elysia marginata]|uniref:Uncharacterized protein n=1 Tax=Elysia marginata TaxID=1093978 RepID=A0AAV4H1M8_9GAST|nr:hypothetical protein ElyMa_004327400 [Elysia marginata]
MKPATDLCFTCQKGATKVARAKHLGEERKSEALQEFEEHLETVTKERSFYKTICDEVKAQIPSNLNLGPHDPSSFDDGTIAAKIFSDRPKTLHKLLKVPLPIPTELPKLINPPGLDNKRQWYLYNEIREFVDEAYRDIAAPLPQQPQLSQHEPSAADISADVSQPPPAKVRKKGKGKKGGSQ